MKLEDIAAAVAMVGALVAAGIMPAHSATLDDVRGKDENFATFDHGSPSWLGAGR